MTEFLFVLNCKSFFYYYLFFLGMLFLITALFLILTDSSIHSILYLMFLFIYLMQLTIILKMEFLALIFIIVYVGAVCILMLFHIKLIKTFINRYDNFHNKNLLIPFLFVSIILPLIQIITLSLETNGDSFFNKTKILYRSLTREGTANIHFNYTSWIDLFDSEKSTQILGQLIYNFYFIYLIFGSFILLVAMIGSIFLTLKKNKEKYFQEEEEQVKKNLASTILMKKNFFKNDGYRNKTTEFRKNLQIHLDKND